MKKLLLKVCSILIAIVLWTISDKVSAQSIRINEFMALNDSTLVDENGNFSDWIELYNYGNSVVNLKGWALTDEKDLPFKWVLPDLSLDAGEYLLIFASGENHAEAGKELHTNFKLSGSGEYFALINPSGKAVTEFDPAFPVQKENFSYGWFNDSFIEFSVSTPGADNNSSSGVVMPNPVFSVKHGFYNAPFQLQITSSLQGAKIYYTLDSSTPGKNNGKLYNSNISISTTSIVRAITIGDGENSSNVVTQSYIFPVDVLRQTNTPEGYPSEWGPFANMGGNAPSDYEMDQELMAKDGFAVECLEALLDIPSISLVSDIGNFFSHSTDRDEGGIYIYTGAPISGTLGRGWERPASFEFFELKSSESVQINCGMKLHGGHGRLPEKSPKHSFLVWFKRKFGPSRLDYAFFGEEGPARNNKIIFRAGFCNSWVHHDHGQRKISQHIRDTWTKDAQQEMGQISGKAIYAHLYLNGLYWGLYNPIERMDKDFGAKHLGGEPEDWDVIKDMDEIADGNNIAWKKLLQMANAGVKDNDDYQRIIGNNPDGSPNPQIESMVDVENLADYMMLNFFGANSDWDHHNWAAMRNRVSPDKGFIFLCWDSEHMVKGIYDNNLGEDNNDCPSRIFKKLMENDEFKRLFANRVQKHCYNGGALTPQANIARWMKRMNIIEKAVKAESARWGDYRRDVHPYQTRGPFELYTYEGHWIPQQTFMLNSYFPQRTEVFVNMLRDKGMFPKVDAPVILLNDKLPEKQIISRGDALSLTTNKGTIYYTTNGTDPVSWNGDQNAGGVSIVSKSATKMVLVPKSDIGSDWYKNLHYDDSAWSVCSGSPGGVGYDNDSDYRNSITLDVKNEMYSGPNPNTSCYIRIPFRVEAGQLSEIISLSLNVNYDDGFIAYINGTKIASSNAPVTISWNSVSTEGHEDDVTESFDITKYLNLLVEGENILAIQGLNQKTSSSDFIINAEIRGDKTPQKEGISNETIVYTGPVTLNNSAHVLARTFYNGEWSALNKHFFIIPDDYSDLKITEINYHPLETDSIDGDKFEFIELKNTGTATLSLEGLRFTDGISYEFPSGAQLRPQEFIVLASDELQFFSRYNFAAFGNYSGNLNNGGEQLVLETSGNDTIIMVKYGDDYPWPVEADGKGYTIVPKELNPSNDQTSPFDWRISYKIGGSPGANDIPDTSNVVPVIKNSESIVLSQNYPNPFSNVTYIDYQIPVNAYVRLSVYNLTGQCITTLVNAHQESGLHQATWDYTTQHGGQLTNGVYIYRLIVQSKNASSTIAKKMMLMR